MATRWVVVDDGDSRIKFNGNWFAATPDQDINGLGNFGTPFQNTLHGINEDGSLSFQFSGSAIMVFGTSRISGFGTTQDPSYECFIDNRSIGAKTPLQFAENNWLFCETSGLSGGSHTLTIQAKVASMTFWLDRIQYAPSSGSDFNQALAWVDDQDSSVSFDSNWEALRDIATMTQTNGAKATVTFNGVSLTWFGFVPGDFPHGSSAGTYVIDGGTPQAFGLRGLPGGGDPMEQYNQVFFQTPTLSPGQHRLEVTFRGDDTVTPLSLDYLIVQN
ncbi:hypothetical protein BJ165DRAFT_1353349, partial [Panaeolus papilionaceus]